VTTSSALTPLARERRPSTGNLVAQRLLDVLLSGEFAVGDRLPPERELAASLEVGRSAVREATQALAMLGLVEVRQGAGTYVRGTTSDLLPKTLEWGLLLGDKGTRDLVETRICIEVEVARLAAERCSADELADLESLVAQMRTAVAAGPETLVELGLAFHLALAQAAHNEVLAGLLESLSELLRAWTRRLRIAGTDPAEVSVRIEQHEAVLEACRRRDPDAAGAAMRAHLRSSLERLKETLQPG
jgi:GntR family transcriptional regulator, transcriptional repressor for pyruvate dehydrogenase complex